MSALTLAEVSAYCAAIYEVWADGHWHNATAFGVPEGPPAVLISAGNPLSQPLSDVENARRHQQLRALIEGGGWRWWVGRGRSADSSWIEESFLVQAPLAIVDGWARDFQQHAVFLPQLATLRFYSPLVGAECPLQMGNMYLQWLSPGSPLDRIVVHERHT